MNDQPEATISAQLEAARARTFEAELEAATALVRLDGAQAELRATQAEARATYAERRLGDLEQALGRRQRAGHDHRLGIERFRPKEGA